jgi:hypothetical protein
MCDHTHVCSEYLKEKAVWMKQVQMRGKQEDLNGTERVSVDWIAPAQIRSCKHDD